MDSTNTYENEYQFIKEGNPIPEIRDGESLLLDCTSFCLYFRDSKDYCFGFIYFNSLSHSGFKYRSEVFQEIDKVCVANGIKKHTVYYTNKILENIELADLYSMLLH